MILCRKEVGTTLRDSTELLRSFVIDRGMGEKQANKLINGNLGRAHSLLFRVQGASLPHLDTQERAVA